jgi:ABC-2 type transport system permease protein/oleandomycin transport system permease protein
VVAIMIAMGFLVGFRVHTNIASFVAGVLIVLLFAYALSWGFCLIALAAPNAETAQLMSFPIIMPFTFASGALVPVATMPSWLQVFARNQPVTKMVDATRALMVGGPVQTPALHAVLWGVGIIAIAAPLAVRRYRNLA